MKDEVLADDLLRGAPAIGRYGGWTLRQTYHLLENNLIPAFKVGKIWNARKSTLRRHIDALEARAVAS